MFSKYAFLCLLNIQFYSETRYKRKIGHQRSYRVDMKCQCWWCYKTQCRWESVTHSLSQTSLGSVPVKVSLMSQKSFLPLSIPRQSRFTQDWQFVNLRDGSVNHTARAVRLRDVRMKVSSSSRHVIASRSLMFTGTAWLFHAAERRFTRRPNSLSSAVC